MSGINLQQAMLPAFATPLINHHWPDSAPLNRQLAELVERLAGEQRGLQKSNVGGWHSDLQFLQRTEPFVVALRQRLNQLVEQLNRAVARQDATPEDLTYRLEGWANKLGFGEYNSLHCHPNSFWSGVYYVTGNEAPPEHPFSGKLELLDPRPGASLAYAEQTNLYGRFLINPVPGQVVVFPSWLQHQVHPCFSEQPRISVAFNVIL
ncbi:MAG: TIGR02466 family protein [Pseudomonadota bacterium]|nr:TIGR02466 family protein [Pseudomonadota bacterium]